ncbi:hypothetical protein D3C84_555940 [compost metagenome]
MAAKIAGNMILGGALTNFLIEKVESSSNAADEAAKKDLETLNQEAIRQRIEMELALQHARIAQELAIAQRIENATSVEIEEFYDISRKGQGGLGVDAVSRTASLGVSGEHNKVSKRVYRFTGFKLNSETETIEQN